MSKSEPIGDQLAALNKLRENLKSAATITQLREALGTRSNHVIARAAEIAAQTSERTLIDDLCQAYRRLMVNPLKTDPGCLGKTAILRALLELGHDDPAIFREGVTYQQPEPVWGPKPKDTAAELRGVCALGLAMCVDNLEVLNCCAVLLVDDCEQARTGAVQALGVLGAAEGGALLRLKLLAGDPAPDVLGECCATLLKLDQQNGFDFVVKLLAAVDADLSVQAGFALGASRRPDAFQPIRNAWQHKRDTAVRGSLLLCLGLLSSPTATTFLLSLITNTDPRAATDAIKALHVLGHNAELKAQTQAAVQATGDTLLVRIFDEEWEE